MRLTNEAYSWLEKSNPLLLFNLSESDVVLNERKKVLLFDEAEVLIIRGVDSFEYENALEKGLMVCLVEENDGKIATFLQSELFTPHPRLFLSKSDKEQIYPILKRFVFKKIQYEGYLSEVASFVDGMQMSFAEYKELGKDVLPNILLNLLHIKEYIDGKELEGLLLGEEVIVCGSGISLPSAMEEIKKMKHRPYIFSVGSALPLLLAEGIIPDFTAVIDHDPSMEGYNCLEHVSIPLFYQNRASKEVLFKHRGIKIFMGSSKGWQIEDALMHDLGRESFAFDAGLHAGNFGAHTALALGCKKIILAGMDGVSKIGERGNLLKEGKATRADLYYGMDFFANLQENFPNAEIEHYTTGFSFNGSKIVDQIQVAPKKRNLIFPEPVCVDTKRVKRVFDHYFSHDMIPLFETFFKKVKEDSSYTKLLAVCLLSEISSKPLTNHFLFPLWEVWKYLLKDGEDELAKITFFYSVLQSIKEFLSLLMKEGPYKRFDKQGTFREEGYIFNGKAEFERKKFDGEGMLICLEKMADGVRHGEYKVYKNEQLSREGIFVKGMPHGRHLCYYKGKVVDLQEFNYGKKCGISKIYDDYGVKREEIIYKENDLFDRIRFDELGQKIYEGIFHGDRYIEKGFMEGKEIWQREGKMVDGMIVFLEQG